MFKFEIRNRKLAFFTKWAYMTIIIMAALTMTILIRENRQIVRDINKDRIAVSYDLCLEQNAKHNELILFLQDVALQQQIEEAKNSGRPLPDRPPEIDPVARKFVNVLAPEQNCKKVIEERFGQSISIEE